MRSGTRTLCVAAWCALAVAGSALAYDITKDKCCFVVHTGHMDTQWQWTRTETYTKDIPKTLHDNFALFRKYPQYIYSFNGAFRYWIVEQSSQKLFGDFKAGDWDTLKHYIQIGRWNCCGGWVEEIDVNIPSPETVIRCGLYGQQYYEDKFGKQSIDVFLPDCFGFSWTLPTIACHIGLRGFSTQKLGWGCWQDPGDSRSICKWYGVDGSYIFCAKDGGTYQSDLEMRPYYGDALYKQCGMWLVYDYMGNGDHGEAPDPDTLAAMYAFNGQRDGIYYFSAAADSLFKELLKLEKAGNPAIAKMGTWNNELITDQHGVGCYTAHADVKMRFRNAEVAGYGAEAAAVIAEKIAGAPYPHPQLWRAWWKTIDHAMHDDLTGTSTGSAYTNSWDGTLPDLDSQIVNFTTLRTAAVSAAAAVLDTRVIGASGVPVMVYNPIGLDRRDVVQAAVTLPSASQYVKILGPDGAETPSQVMSGGGTTSLTVLFVAAVPSVGYAVYEVQPSATACAIPTGLSVAGDGGSMANNEYSVTIDGTGDIGQIADKRQGNKNLFSGASRWELRNDPAAMFGAWEIEKDAIMAAPTGVVDQSVVKTVVETGPVRVSVKVTRSKNNSTFTHYYRLYADSAGRIVHADNTINWNTDQTFLKASFYLAASADSATFGLGLGTVNRPISGKDNRYEVPSQQWACINNADNTYGTAVISQYKYGWSRLLKNSLSLTLIHTPYPLEWGYGGDKYTHTVSYGIHGYGGTWKNGVEAQSLRYNFPLLAYQATSHAPAAGFGKTYSFVRTSDPSKIMIMCVKKAEKSAAYVVRVREIAAASSSVKLVFGHPIVAAEEDNGLEKTAAAATFTGNELSFSINKYQLRTFKVSLAPVGVGPGAGGTILAVDERAFRVVAPARGRTAAARFLLGAGEKVRRVTIGTMTGRIVRTLYDGPQPLQGASAISWNGRDRTGAPAGAGVYFVTVVTDRATRHAPLHLVR